MVEQLRQQTGFDFLAEVPKLAEHLSLADRFIVPPFSILDTRQGYWQERKRLWLSLGFRSELGRGQNAVTYQIGDKTTWEATKAKGYQMATKHNQQLDEKTQKALGCYASAAGATIDRNTGGQVGTSVFDPVLCELVYRWFCPVGGRS